MKQFILTWFSLVLGCTAFSQAPAIVWKHTYGGPSIQGCNDVFETSDGGFMVFGNSTTAGGDVASNYGGTDVWVFKTDSAGTLLWKKNMGGSDDDVIFNAAETADGGYVFCGYTLSNDFDLAGMAYGNYDVWVVKIDGSGNILWKKVLGNDNEDKSNSISRTADGGYIVTGYTKSYQGVYNHGQFDVFVVKLDAMGNVTWLKCYGGTGLDRGSEIIQTADGGYAIIGEADTANGNITASHGLLDVWVIKISATGTLQWQKTYGGSAKDMGRSILQDADGGYTIAGETFSTDGDITGQHGGKDIWLAKLDGAGTLLWSKCLGGPGWEDCQKLAKTSNGFILTGTASDIGGDVTNFHGYYDAWIVRLDAQGSILWQRAYGGSDQDNGLKTISTSDGGSIVAALTLSEDGDVVPEGAFPGSTSKAWLIRLAPDNLDAATPEKRDIALYPNPANNILYLAGDVSGLEKAEVYDLGGKCILHTAVNPFGMDISALAAGAYFIQLSGPNATCRFKFLKM